MSTAAAMLVVEGMGFWASGIPGLQSLRALLAGAAGGTTRDVSGTEATPQPPPPTRPAPVLLAANERRRAPDTVLLALEAAQAACAMAGRDPATLPSVFASCHGDLAITEAICTALARAPQELSPTRFHNSVHNAAAGYWTIGAGCHAPATAVSAHAGSFAQALVEAAAQALTEATPVLLVGYDAASPGALADVSPSTGLLALALVLAPAAGATGAGPGLALALERGDAPPHAGALQAQAGGNAMAAALPLAAALAEGVAAPVLLHAGPGSRLRVDITGPALP